MPYEVCIFDLDGTLTNPYDGLVKGIKHAIEKLGLDYKLDNPGLFIGPPLQDSFKKEFKLTDAETGHAVSVFREYYSAKGLYENEVYPGIAKLLENLKTGGVKLAVATTKPDNFAHLVLEHFDLDTYFELIQGDAPGMNISKNGKQELINIALDAIDPERKKTAVMIGDRHHDIDGARKAGIDSIGITWGYGSRDEFLQAGATHIAGNTDEVLKLVLG